MSKYINADDLLSVLKDVHPMDYYAMALKAQIISLPPADVVEVKHGKWLDKGSLSCRCSNCGCKSSKETKFCPNCGADMRERRETE